MFSEQIELRGHIIDSLILPKVLDVILTCGGTFTIREIRIGKQRHDASYACIDVFGPSPEAVDQIVRRVGPHRAPLVGKKSGKLAGAPAGGGFSIGLFSSPKPPTFESLRGKWS